MITLVAENILLFYLIIKILLLTEVITWHSLASSSFGKIRKFNNFVTLTMKIEGFKIEEITLEILLKQQ